MVSTKKLLQVARKLRKLATIGRQNVSFPRVSGYIDLDRCKKSSVVNKGHFVICTMDQRRFVIPLSFLSNEIFHELLKMSEEEFGLPSEGPITLPCDSVFMDNMVFLVGQGLGRSFEKAVINYINTTNWFFSCLCSPEICRPTFVC